MPNDIAFSDVGRHAPERTAIENMVSQGIMNSVSPGRFNPDGVVKRGDFVVFVQRMFNLAPPNQLLAFADVNPKDPIFSAVQAVAPFMNMQLLCPGCALSGLFTPAKPMTRAEAVIVITRVLVAQKRLKLLAPQEVDGILADVPDIKMMSFPARRYFATALDVRMVTLRSDKSFQPASQHTRKEAAALLDNVQTQFSIPIWRQPL